MRLDRVTPYFLWFYITALATSMSFMEIGSGLLLIVALTRNYRCQISWRTPLAKPVLFFCSVIGIGILLGDSTIREMFYDLGRLRFFVLYFVLYAVLVNQRGDRRWLTVLRGITTVIGCYGFVQHFIAIDLIRPEGKKVLLYALQDEKIGPLVVGTFNHHLTFSNSYLFFSCLFLSLGFSAPKQNRYDLLLGAFLLLLVFWTQSRIAWVAIPVCIVLLSFFHFGKKAMVVTLASTLVLLVTLYLSNQSFQDRLAKTFQTSDHRSFVPRLNLWKAQIAMWKESPLFGVGWNNNERHSKEYVDRLVPGQKDAFYGHAHSMPLQILATTGIFGAFAFFWLWLCIFRQTVFVSRLSENWARSIGIGALASFTGFWIQGLTQWNFGDAEVVHTVIFFWALVSSLYSNNSTHSS